MVYELGFLLQTHCEKLFPLASKYWIASSQGNFSRAFSIPLSMLRNWICLKCLVLFTFVFLVFKPASGAEFLPVLDFHLKARKVKSSVINKHKLRSDLLPILIKTSILIIEPFWFLFGISKKLLNIWLTNKHKWINDYLFHLYGYNSK